MDKISVVLATYNGEKYILDQLESIYRQRRKPDEVIIRDDCSTDRTCDLIESFISTNKLKWKLIKGDSNIGFINNFTEALKSVTGDIIFLCDQDDIWKENKIYEMTSIMSKHHQILCLNSSYECIDSIGKKIPVKTFPFTSNNGLIIGKIIKKNTVCSVKLEDITKYNISMGCTMALKKSLLKDYMNNAGYALHDWLINILAARNDGLFFYNKPLINYRIHSNNTIGQDDEFIPEKVKRIEMYSNNIAYFEDFLKCNYGENDIRVKKELSKSLFFYRLRKKILLDERISIDEVLQAALTLKIRNIFLVRDLLIKVK